MKIKMPSMKAIYTDPDFTFVNPTAKEGGVGFITYNQPPFYKGKIILFKKIKPDGMLHFIQKNKPLAYAVVPGYSMIVTYYSQKEKLDLIEIDLNHLSEIFTSMATYYLNFRVLPNHSRYKQYKTDAEELSNISKSH